MRLGAYRGATYTRTWFSVLAGLPPLVGAYFSILGGTSAWLVLVPLAAVVVGVLWLVPQSVVSESGIRWVLRRESVPWSGIARVLDPRPGDEEARVELADGRVRAVSGVPPRHVPDLRALHGSRR